MGGFVRIFEPTQNRRLNELIGFLGVTLTALMALSLLSYNPHDASLNVADRKSTRLNSSHIQKSRMPSSA